MILWWMILRKKILRRLSKTFGQKYNFKRLLQTTPTLSKLYTIHEDAVNSIKPIKHVQILPRLALRAYDPNATVDINAACKVEIYGPNQKSWPCRIKYAEQILDVYKHNYSAWVVRVGHYEQAEGQVEIVEFKNPYIIFHYPGIQNDPFHNKPIYNPKKLSRLDENDFAPYFLASKTTNPTPLHLAGIIPNGQYIYNSTFYDREIAHLYAESLQVEAYKWYTHRPYQL